MKYPLLLGIIILILMNGCTDVPSATHQPEIVLNEIDGGLGNGLPAPDREVNEQEDEELGDDIDDEIIDDQDELDEDELIEPGLIAHWKFDEEGGSVVKDSAGGNDGIIIRGVTRIDRLDGKALNFNSTDGFVDFPIPVIDEMGELSKGTIAFWFKFENILDKQPIMPIFYFGKNDGSGKDDMFIIEIGHTNFMRPGIVYDPNNTKLYATWVVNDQEPVLCYDSKINLEENTWYHYALVIDDSGNTGYLNGEEMTNRNYNFGNKNDTMLLSAIQVQEKFSLGYGKTHHDISPNYVYFKGAIDDIRIYNRTLTSEEIQGLQ